jgi:hypothetical protein
MNPTDIREYVEAHLYGRHERMAIIGFDSVDDEYTVFDLITQLREDFPSHQVRLLRPSERDTTDAPGIVLVTDKSQLSEDNVAPETVYLVDNTNNLKRELVRYTIDND